MNRRIIRLAAILVFLAAGHASSQADPIDVKLADKPVSIHVSNRPLFDVCLILNSRYGIPVGMEESSLDSEHDDYFIDTSIPFDKGKVADLDEKAGIKRSRKPKKHLISLDFTEAPLAKVLDSLVSQMQFYNWEISDDVVDLYPINGRDARFERLMDLHINGFSAKRGTMLAMIYPVIDFFMPEVKAYLKQNGLSAEPQVVVSTRILRSLTEDIVLKDLTFKQMLNRITAKKQGGWMLRYGKRRKNDKDGNDVIEIVV